MTERGRRAQPALKMRPGDQPLPNPNDLPAVQDQVIADIEERKTVGLERYGTLLQPLNGRSAMRDAYEESLDLVMYLRQIREEHRLLGDRIRNLADQVAAHGGLVGLVDDLNEIANILYPDQEA